VEIFEKIHPEELVTDGDPLFRSAAVRDVLTNAGVAHTIRSAKQDLAIVDNLIGRVKRAVAEEEASTDDRRHHEEPSVVRAVAAFNRRGLDVLYGAAPDEVRANRELRFQLDWDAGKAYEHNAKAAVARGNELAKTGSFRTLAPVSGFRRRVDQPTWSREVRTVDRIEGPWVYSGGHRYRTSEVLPVHGVTVGGERVVNRPHAREILKPFADRLAAFLATQPGSRATGKRAMQIMSQVGNLREAMKNARVKAVRPVNAMATHFSDNFHTTVSGSSQYIG
jgi:hypothetical protein